MVSNRSVSRFNSRTSPGARKFLATVASAAPIRSPFQVCKPMSAAAGSARATSTSAGVWLVTAKQSLAWVLR